MGRNLNAADDESAMIENLDFLTDLPVVQASKDWDFLSEIYEVPEGEDDEIEEETK